MVKMMNCEKLHFQIKGLGTYVGDMDASYLMIAPLNGEPIEVKEFY